MLNPAILRYGVRTARLLQHQGPIYRNSPVLLCQPVAHFSSTFDSMYNKMINLEAVHYMEDTLAHLHNYTGIPWYGSIMLFTVGLRTIMSLPAQVTSHKVAAKRTIMFKEINEILPSLKEASEKHVRLNNFPAGEAPTRFKRVAQAIHRVKVIEYNCHFSKLFLPLYIQIPVWMFNSIAIRNICLLRADQQRIELVPVEERNIQMAAEGALWFPNLTTPDPLFILPVIVGISFATNIFLGSARTPSPEKAVSVSKYQKGITIFMYSIAFMMVPISAIQPSALSLYWATSGAMDCSKIKWMS